MNVLLGVTGGIAAYKAALLVRLFKKNGHQVRVIMTRSAKDFITPLTLATLSGNPILVENFSPEDGAWNSHISISEWADVMVIAPATANTLAKMAHGIADNLLLCAYLSARCDVWIAPAMDLEMYAHPATQENIKTLMGRGVRVVEPGTGFLASGLEGKGRMAEPENIFEAVINGSKSVIDSKLRGKKVIVTAGATVEKIDPVRFISNFSTGRMGIELADVLAARGAIVTLVKGATTVHPAKPKMNVVEALSADQMYKAVDQRFAECDIAIFAAAVADYTPQRPANQKIKKETNDENIVLTLRQTNDIAACMGTRKHAGQHTIGFALETCNGMENARAKLAKKHLDAIVLNTLEDQGAGFATATNKITILDRSGVQKNYNLKDKALVACDIADYLETIL